MGTEGRKTWEGKGAPGRVRTKQSVVVHPQGVGSSICTNTEQGVLLRGVPSSEILTEPPRHPHHRLHHQEPPLDTFFFIKPHQSAVCSLNVQRESQTG